MMIEGVRTRLIGECLLLEKAQPKVTPQHAAADRVQVIYNSFRARDGGWGCRCSWPGGPASSSPLAAAAAAVMEIPLTAPQGAILSSGCS